MEWVVEAVLSREVRKLTASIEEEDTQLALLNDDLTEPQELVRQLEYNNTGLQREIRAKDQEIARLHERVVPHADCLAFLALGIICLASVMFAEAHV